MDPHLRPPGEPPFGLSRSSSRAIEKERLRQADAIFVMVDIRPGKRAPEQSLEIKD